MNSKIYRQADSRWGSLPYPTRRYTFARNGCGCCSVTHVAIEQDKYKNYTPATVRKFMVQYATQGNGTRWAGITAGLQHYGYKVHWKSGESMSSIFNVLKNSVRKGVILFGSSRGPDGTVWTTGGHYIAFVDYKVSGGKHWFYLKDSGGRKHDGWYSYERSMKGDVRQVWVCTASTIKPDTEKVKKAYTGKLPTVTVYKGNCTAYRAKLVQAYINWFYQKVVLTVDGVFGAKTEAKVKALQKAWNLKQTGRVDAAWKKKARAEKR